MDTVNPIMPATFDGMTFVLVVIAGLQVFLFVAAVVGVLRSPRLTSAGRLLWVVVVFAFPFLGAIAWFAWGRTARLDRGIV